MLHRAILGSLERFMALYIEHTGGDFPFWLAPVQVAILPISSDQAGHARDVERKLRDAGLRAHLDDRSETLGFKIREAELQKVPLSLVIGEKELADGTVTPRMRKSKKKKFESLGIDELVSQLVMNVAERRAGPLS